MKKKRASNPKPAKKSAKSKSAPFLLPGLGGEPWDPMPTPASRLEMERVSRALGKLMESKDFDGPEDANAFLSSLAGGTFDEIIDMVDADPEEEAQDLAYEAMEARSKSEARGLVRKALAIDPHCLDALIIQAKLDARSDKDLAGRIRTIVRGVEERFGKAYMDENRGHFWGMVETRPYMRARGFLASLLRQTGDLEGAIFESEGLLTLNPGDNQGIRDDLRGMYLEKGDVEGVRRLNAQYDDAVFAVPAWSSVLELWLSGDLEQAEKQARSAHKNNVHVVGYLTGTKRQPMAHPDYYSPGDENEAKLCACLLGGAWRAHPEATAWLRGLNLK